MSSLRTFGVGAVSLALILLVATGGYNLFALNLGTVTGDYFKGALAVFVLLGGTWLTMQGQGTFGKPFMAGAALLLLTISIRHRAPGIVELVSQTTNAASREAQNAAVDLSAARTLPCDRTTPSLRFFERETGAPLVWAAETDDGRLICYDRPGFHPQTRTKLVAVDERLARAILTQEPPFAAVPAAPATEPTPTPLRELGEGPVPR